VRKLDAVFHVVDQFDTSTVATNRSPGVKYARVDVDGVPRESGRFART
jgi:hypothetical protein